MENIDIFTKYRFITSFLIFLSILGVVSCGETQAQKSFEKIPASSTASKGNPQIGSFSYSGNLGQAIEVQGNFGSNCLDASGKTLTNSSAWTISNSSTPFVTNNLNCTLNLLSFTLNSINGQAGSYTYTGTISNLTSNGALSSLTSFTCSPLGSCMGAANNTIWLKSNLVWNPGSQPTVNLYISLDPTLVSMSAGGQYETTSATISSNANAPAPSYTYAYTPGLAYDIHGYIQPNISSEVQFTCNPCTTPAEYYTILGTTANTVGGGTDSTETDILTKIPNWTTGASQTDLDGTWSIFKDFFNAHKDDLFIKGSPLPNSITIPLYKAPDTYPLVTTLAGTLSPALSSPCTDGTGSNVGFGALYGIIFDNYRNNGDLFIADYSCGLRKITSSGVVTTFNATKTLGLSSLVMDKSTGDIYGGQYANPASVYKFLASDNYSTANLYAGASAPISVSFSNIRALVFDSHKNLFVADFVGASSTASIVQITPSGQVSVIMNQSTPTVYVGKKIRMTIDSKNNIYFGYDTSNAILKISLNYDINNKANPVGSGSTASVFAGDLSTASYVDGNGTSARFFNIASITTDDQDNIYVADSNNVVIRKITPTGDVTTLVGSYASSGFQDSDTIGSSAKFNFVFSMAFNPLNRAFYVNDFSNSLIRKIDLNKNTTLKNGFSLVQPVDTASNVPCGVSPTSCSITKLFTNYTTGTLINNFGIVNDYLTFKNYQIPTFIPNSGLVYYVLFVHVDSISGLPSFQIFKINIARV